MIEVRENEVVLAWEVPVERGLRYPGLADDGVDPDAANAACIEEAKRGLQDAIPRDRFARPRRCILSPRGAGLPGSSPCGAPALAHRTILKLKADVPSVFMSINQIGKSISRSE